jgi:hypothetical protein
MNFGVNKTFLLVVTSVFLIGTVSFVTVKANARKNAGSFLANIPKRSYTALTGSQFIAKTSRLTTAQREEAIVKEIISGNIPNFLRHTQTISYKTKLKNGKFQRVEMNVMPDYLAIGSDKDFVRIPMSPISAQKIADRYNLVLPTAKIVDEIYKNSSLKYTPSPLPPGKKMVTSDVYKQHNQLIEKQRKGRSLDQLASGHKKDVVLTNRLNAQPRKVAIYGWHRPNGKAIQPLSLVHGNYYADYSHGIRLVDPWIKVDGKRRNISGVMSDKNLASLVSNEGKMTAASAYRAGKSTVVVAKLNKKKTGKNTKLAKYKR